MVGDLNQSLNKGKPQDCITGLKFASKNITDITNKSNTYPNSKSNPIPNSNDIAIGTFL